MAKPGRKSEAKELERRLLAAWHDPAEKDNSIKARAKRGMQLGSIRAVERIIALIESEDERVAFAAAREILQRNFGMPKQAVDVAVTDTSAAHHAALRAIYDKALARLEAREHAPIDAHAETIQPLPEMGTNELDSGTDGEQGGNKG